VTEDISGLDRVVVGKGQGATTDAHGMIKHALPYKPSWVNRLTGWVRRLPLPAWVFYLSLGIALMLLASLALWVSGMKATSTFLLYSVTGMSQAYLLALIHYLDNSAETALARFRPVMTVDDAGYEKLRYQLTTLPARPALIGSCLGIGYAIAILVLNRMTDGNPAREMSPPLAIVLYVVYSILLSWLAALVAYHTIHQLHMVSLIYTKHTRINLFQLGPMYTLSNLAARTAIGIALPTYLWFWLNFSAPSGLSLSDVIPAIFFGSIILVTFIWPLLGAHRLLEREKQRLLDEIAQRIETTITELHNRIDTGELDDKRGVLKDTLDGLVIEQGVIHKLRTWPWRTETVSSVGAAFLLPIIIWVFQRMLTRLGF